jgi:hypothetical protein
MDKLWPDSILVALEAMRKENVRRVGRADAASMECCKSRLRSQDTVKKVKQHQQQLKEGFTYGVDVAD